MLLSNIIRETFSIVFISPVHKPLIVMAATDTERPSEALEAARLLASIEDRSVVGVGDYIALWESQFNDDCPDGRIVVCEINGFDYCDTSDRIATHSKRVFSIHKNDPELDPTPTSKELVA